MQSLQTAYGSDGIRHHQEPPPLDSDSGYDRPRWRRRRLPQVTLIENWELYVHKDYNCRLPLCCYVTGIQEGCTHNIYPCFTARLNEASLSVLSEVQKELAKKSKCVFTLVGHSGFGHCICHCIRVRPWLGCRGPGEPEEPQRVVEGQASLRLRGRVRASITLWGSEPRSLWVLQSYDSILDFFRPNSKKIAVTLQAYERGRYIYLYIYVCVCMYSDSY